MIEKHRDTHTRVDTYESFKYISFSHSSAPIKLRIILVYLFFFQLDILLTSRRERELRSVMYSMLTSAAPGPVDVAR